MCLCCQSDSELSAELLPSFESVSMALLQSTCKSYALKRTASVLVPGCGLRQLAASSHGDPATKSANVCFTAELCLQRAGSVTTDNTTDFIEHTCSLEGLDFWIIHNNTII